MKLVIEKYDEPLEDEELRFLRRKEAHDRRQFYKVVRALMILCFICPYIVAIIRACAGVNNPFSAPVYFLGVAFLLLFSGISLYISYYYYLRKVQRDIRSGTKIIERAHITRKLYMPHNNTFHLYLDSPSRLSIEVQQPDYQRFDKGDEVNIEYTAYSKMYLGYF